MKVRVGPQVLQVYPGLREHLKRWARLSLMATDGLVVQVLHPDQPGSIYKRWVSLVLDHMDDPRVLQALQRQHPPRAVVAHYYRLTYQPLGATLVPYGGTIELELKLDRARWERTALYFFHELGHHSQHMGSAPMSEKDTDRLARKMMRRVRGPAKGKKGGGNAEVYMV